MTDLLYNESAYMRECESEVLGFTALGGIILSRTVFYVSGGGQAGDSGILRRADGVEVDIATVVRDGDDIVHVVRESEQSIESILSVGDKVECEIDWDLRYNYMRMHTSLHLLCACISAGVTGGQVGATKSRLDFDIGDLTLDKDDLTRRLNELIAEGHAVSVEWMSESELANNLDLVRTMSVSPPKGRGDVRLLRIGDNVDLQPCGGTHVANVSEIGSLRVSKIENKGAKNRRVHIVFGD